MRSSDGGAMLASSLCLLVCSVPVAFVPLSLIDSVVSLFLGARVKAAMGGVQHGWGGVRAMMLLVAKATSLSSSASLQSELVSLMDGLGVGGRVAVALWLGAEPRVSF